MSFSFSFSGDDIEDDTTLDSSTAQRGDILASEDSITTKLQNTKLAPTLLPPKKHDLLEFLKSLPSQVSYNYLDIPPQNSYQRSQVSAHGEPGLEDQNGGADRAIRVPRRSLFDIRQQLMAESDPSNNDDETGNLLSGLETGDLRSGIYEGGFKTWECAVDLGGFVQGESDGRDALHVVELGAGSSVPSIVLLRQLLRERNSTGGQEARGKVKFTLCDYNEDVLRLGTAVNVFLAAVLEMVSTDDEEEQAEEGEIEVNENLVGRTVKTLDDADVTVDFISGAWGDEFVQLAMQDEVEGGTRLLLLASETIYSPESLRSFSQTVLNILKRAKGEKKAYVAAKKVYFGVGGGVQEFEEEVRTLGGRTEVVLDVKSAGVGRVVLDISV